MPTVLVIDANPDAPVQVRRLIGKMNTVVFEAAHLEFALELLRRGTIAVIIVGERVLGQQSSLDVIRTLRQRDANLRIVYRASDGAAGTLPSALAAGADDAVLENDADALVTAVGKTLRAA